MNKYSRECKGVEIDVYDVLKSFNVTNPAIAHAIKKLLAGGQRGYKDIKQDYTEAIASIYRGIELEYTTEEDTIALECRNCMYYHPVNESAGRCEVVRGSTRAGGTCDEWAKK